ncbi:MAG: type II toxin-antitoxin system VapB family antitoxin [Candidatus Competibacter denitrificans]|jgi:antitoxin VapB
MPINVNNPEADALTRKFAGIMGVGLTEAIIIAMKEAIARRRTAETPLEIAARIRKKYGVSLSDDARQPLPKPVFNAMWDNGVEQEG